VRPSLPTRVLFFTNTGTPRGLESNLIVSMGSVLAQPATSNSENSKTAGDRRLVDVAGRVANVGLAGDPFPLTPALSLGERGKTRRFIITMGIPRTFEVFIECRMIPERKWSERQDLNLRRLGPKPSALARLSYAPTTGPAVFHNARDSQSESVPARTLSEWWGELPCEPSNRPPVW
jgi:hypothetical protein